MSYGLFKYLMTFVSNSVLIVSSRPRENFSSTTLQQRAEPKERVCVQETWT